MANGGVPVATPLPENQTTSWPQITPGISRDINNMGVGLPVPDPLTEAPTAENGGGDKNGTAALILFGHSGTGLGKLAMPRLSGGAINVLS